MQDPKKIRNIAIIAHVDHGKTTLVDHLIRQAGTFRDNEHVADRMMDSMDLEKERGITIAAKNASFLYQDYKINIVDTPGHSDFGGEVERILNMVEGAILLVDSSEGPLPQTRFVLKKALEQNLKILVCINKIDRPDSRIEEVHDEIFSLFVDLGASDEQCNFSVIYAIAREGKATLDINNIENNLKCLYEAILNEIPAPQVIEEDSLQLMISQISYSQFLGRLAVGKVLSGNLKVGDEVLCMMEKDQQKKSRISGILQYKVNQEVPVQEVGPGDIAIVAGISDFAIGDTLTSVFKPLRLPRIKVEEPTVGIIMSVNDGYFAGRDGKHLTSRKILERLEKEVLHNVALKLELTDSPDSFKIIGRGELQLAVLVEQMRREGFEVCISKPQVVLKTIDGKVHEPFEIALMDIEDAYVGVVTEKMGLRKGIMLNMHLQEESKRVRLEFKVPSRALIGYRSEFLTDTRGTGLLNRTFDGYYPYIGDFSSRINGALISDRQGVATTYALYNLQDRGRMFIHPTQEVYMGMIIGEHSRDNDLDVNITREKKLTNVRAAGADEKLTLIPVQPMTLERAMEWITEEELIEITPANIRLRCRYLDPARRKLGNKK